MVYVAARVRAKLGGLRNHDCEAEDNVDKNEFIFYIRISRYSKIIYLVYHCQNYKTDHKTKLNPEHSDKFEKKTIKEVAGVVHVLQTTQNWAI